MQNMTNSTAKKKIKKQGIFRTGAIVPFGIFVALLVIFQIFFIDGLIKMVMEKLGTRIHGAEVNVSGVETKISNLSIEIGRIQFTNRDKPERNNFEIGSIRFALMWDALLRGKFVIEESSINNILLDTKRNSRGFVTPIAKEEAEKKNETLQNAEKEFEGNIFEVLVAEYVKLVLFKFSTERKEIIKNNQLSDMEMQLPPGNKILK